MKLAFYISCITGGGAARVMTLLANYFCNEAEDIIFVTNRKNAQEYTLDSRIRRYVLDENSRSCYAHRMLKNIMYVYSLRKILIDAQPETLFSFLPEPCFRAVLASQGLRMRVILSVRSTVGNEFDGRVYKFLAKILYPRADCVVFQTERAKNEFNEKVARVCSAVIPNPVMKGFYLNRWDGAREGICTCGRLTKSKNHRNLICAFKKIQSAVSDNLYIYGEGELRQELQEYINANGLQGRVFLMGNVSQVEKKINKARLFVLSSDVEGMPNALMEAMALGIPCISTDYGSGAAKELLGEDANLYLVPPKDSKALSEAMLCLLENESMAQKLSQNAKKKLEDFRIECIAPKWLQCT